MSRPEDDDAWLDAFDPSELDHPELDEVDASVDRVLRRLGRRGVDPVAPPRTRPVAALVVGALALAAGALFGVWWAGGTGARDGASGPVAEAPAPAPAPTAEALQTASVAPPSGGAAPGPASAPPPRVVGREAPPAPTVATVAPAGSEPVEAVVEVAASRPGLLPHRDALWAVEGDAAVLTSGLLTWIHDEEHDPGVGRVVLRDLPLVVRPVGTAFTVAAAPPLASVAVREGHVRVEHADGSLLAALGPGEELTVAADARSPLGLRLLETDDRPLDEVAAMASRRCCRPEDLVALVASLRLAGMEAPEPLEITDDLPEGP